MKSVLASIICMPLLWVGAYWAGQRMDNARIEIPTSTEESILVTPVVSISALGYNQLVADVLWMNAIQYFANQDASNSDFSEIHGRMLNIIKLDPEFEYVYRFGWTTYIFFDQREQKFWLEDATDLLERGWRRHPASCRMAKDLGFHYYYYLEDYERAANLLDRAAELCNFHSFSLLAARLRANVGDEDTSIIILLRIAETTTSDRIRERVEKRILELYTSKTLRIMRTAAINFQKTHGGRYPNSMIELIRSGLLEHMPKNLLPGEYVFGPNTILHTGLRDNLKLHRP